MRKKKKSCGKGHRFTEKNLYLYYGKQYCKKCMAVNQAAYRARLKKK